MRIIVVGTFHHIHYAAALSQGFKALGHDVMDINYSRYGNGGPLKGILDKIQAKYQIGFPMIKYNRDIVSAVETFKPDFVFFYRCYHVLPKTFRWLKKQGVCFFTYNNDDPLSNVPSKSFFRYFMKSLRYASHNFVYRKKNVDDYHRMGIDNVSVLMPNYITTCNFWKPETQRDIPIGYIGHFENDGRDECIKALLDAGLPVTIFNGSYWERAPLYEEIKQVIQPAKRNAEYNDTLNKMQMSLVFLSKHNHDTYTRRCFEVPVTKTLMVSEYTEDMDAMYPDGECAVYFRTKEELVEKCTWLLKNPSEIERMANNAYRKLMEMGGSEVDRAKEVIALYQQLTIH